MALSPAERYESCSQLGDDIERFLADEPILALVDPTLVRLRRWMRNHQTITITAATLIVASTLGLSVFSSLLTAKQNELELTNQNLVVAERQAKESAQVAEQRRVEAEGRRKEADVARRLAEQAQAAEQEAKADALAFSDFLVNNLLASARPKDVYGGLGIDITVVDAIQTAELNLSAVFEGRPRAEATARLGIGDTWYNLGEYQRAVEQLTKAEELFRQTSGGLNIETLTARSALALSLAHLGDLDRAIEAQQEIAATLEGMLGPAAKETLTARSNLALSLSHNGDYAEAIPILREVFELSRDNLGERVPATLRSKNNYADALRYAGDDRRQEAIELLQEHDWLASADSGTKWRITNNLADSYLRTGEPVVAISILQPLLEEMQKKLNSGDPELETVYQGLAVANLRAGHLAEATRLFASAVERQLARYAQSDSASDRSMVRGLLVYLANCQLASGDYEAAELCARESAEIARELLPEDWRRFNAESIWGEALFKLGRLEQAATIIEASHSQLIARKSLLPRDLQMEFLVQSFDRMIMLSEARQDSAAAQKIEREKSMFLKAINP